MNSQREVIYKRRRHALFGERIQVDIANMIFDVCESVVNEYHGGDFEDFKLELIRVLSIESPVTEEQFMKDKPEDISSKLHELVLDAHKRKVETISKQAYPVIKDVYENKAEMYENIVVPISDGTKNFQVVTNLKKAYETEAKELVRAYEKIAILATIDDSWKEHLREMDDLKQSVQNASYEQKDPLLIYKFESFNLFKTMIEETNKLVVATLMKGHIPLQMPDEVKEAKVRRRTDMSGMKTSKEDLNSDGRKEPKKAEPVRNAQKVGRNEPCPCGSGKKFKQCHGKGVPA
jgi:preprotein translocase subunit SecA